MNSHSVVAYSFNSHACNRPNLPGDNLKLIHGEAGDPRPKEFVSKEGSGLTLMVLKRAKP